MAPRPLESRDEVIARIRRAGQAIAREPLRFGGHHFTHVVVVEGGRWRIRRLALDPEKARAYLEEHGMFMPEHAEMLSEPGPQVTLEADSLEGLVAALKKASWPLPM